MDLRSTRGRVPALPDGVGPASMTERSTRGTGVVTSLNPSPARTWRIWAVMRCALVHVGGELRGWSDPAARGGHGKGLRRTSWRYRRDTVGLLLCRRAGRSGRSRRRSGVGGEPAAVGASSRTDVGARPGSRVRSRSGFVSSSAKFVSYVGRRDSEGGGSGSSRVAVLTEFGLKDRPVHLARSSYFEASPNQR